ncbi:MAG: hypothetical protein HUU20_20320, partial [Pirellulales bacterium]|nr:hypothetical protein [Pirellulales bacterium]
KGEAPGGGPAQAAMATPDVAPKRKGPLVAAGIVLALVVISIPAFIFAQYLINSRKQPAPAPAPPPVAAAPAPSVSAEQKRQWMEEVAAATAKRLDDQSRLAHSAGAIMASAPDATKLIESLAQGKFPEAAEPNAAKPPEPQPYQSQYEALHKECLAHLQANLPQGDFDRAKVEEVAGAWAATKQAPLEKQLQEQIEKQILVR